MKDDYIRHVLEEFVLNGNFDSKFGGGWIDSEELSKLTFDLPVWAFADFGYDASGKYVDQSALLINSLLANTALIQEGDEYSGFWTKLRIGQKVKYLQSLREGNVATKRVSSLGEIALKRALQKIAGEDGLSPLSEAEVADTSILVDELDATLVPASDRLVSLKHNEQSEIEGPLEEVLSLVEAENSIHGEEGLRELTLGRLRAGRELIKAGVFSLRSLHLTLIVGLQMLVEKYGNSAIGIVATKLLDLVLKQYGIG